MSTLNKRTVLAGLAGVAAAPAFAQAPAPTAAARIELTTALGVIALELATQKAPITCANFLRYVDAGRLDGAAFYRAMTLGAAPPAGLVQGGLNGDPARMFPAIAHESTLQTGLRHKDGVISMARYAPGTATSEFFICVGDIPSLDADPTASGDNQGFAAFGQVTAGMDTVRKILASPVSKTAGDGAMVGQMLSPTIAIISAKRS